MQGSNTNTHTHTGTGISGLYPKLKKCHGYVYEIGERDISFPFLEFLDYPDKAEMEKCCMVSTQHISTV